MKKSIFQTVIFVIISVTMNGQSYKPFKNILYCVQTRGKGGYSHFKYYISRRAKMFVFFSYPQLCFTIKECKINLSNNICLITFSVHYLSVQNAVNTLGCEGTNGDASVFIV